MRCTWDVYFDAHSFGRLIMTQRKGSGEPISAIHQAYKLFVLLFQWFPRFITFP